MHGFVIIRELRSGCEQARLKLFQFNQLLVLFVGVTDAGQKVAINPPWTDSQGNRNLEFSFL